MLAARHDDDDIIPIIVFPLPFLYLYNVSIDVFSFFLWNMLKGYFLVVILNRLNFDPIYQPLRLGRI